MSEEVKDTAVATQEQDGGRIVFADDVVATIAALAAAEVPGVDGMSGGVVDGFTEKLGRKNVTKGVKVEVGTEEAAIDLSVNIKFGYRIREVCEKMQQTVKNSVETMTGLKVVEVNVYVQSVTFEPTEPTKEELRAERKREAELLKEQKTAEKEAAKAEKEAAKVEKEAEVATATVQPRVK